MELETLYYRVKEEISGLDFEAVWPGFKPLKFALYDDEKCFFDGSYIDKTDAFCANTSIVFRGEHIAIWMVQGEMEIPVLTSKIVHEMFHGYQAVSGWDCRPNEMEALCRYSYDARNLALKLRENELLLGLLQGPDEAAIAELLSIKKLRSELSPYEFRYESMAEEIEGTANYVEWQALKQLDEDKARALTERMRGLVTKPEYLFPIRISCYFTGALMINALRGAGLYSFEPCERPMIFGLLNTAEPFEGRSDADRLAEIKNAVDAFNAETEEIINSALENDEAVLTGPYELTGVNVYNARRRNGFITTTYFLMYRDGDEDRLLQGDFVIKMRDEKTIERVYRLK